MKRVALALLHVTWLMPTAAVAEGQTIPLDSLVVTATRTEMASVRVPFSVRVIAAEDLETGPTALDNALRSYPGFNLFRRSDSLTANPTAQGVSVRGVGPSGASRSLVLLDGIPLNDPFGGWVSWSKVPRESLARVEMVPGGGATPWGNTALGGVINLLTDKTKKTGGRVSVLAGDFGLRSAEIALSQPVGPGQLHVSSRFSAFEGFRTVAEERRGPVDTPAGGRHHWLNLQLTEPIGPSAEVTVTGRAFEENRENGTRYQRNSSDELFAAVALAVRPSETLHWRALAYGQDQTFSSTFSGINATRTTETPASDQFAVPSTAQGFSATAHWAHPQGGSTGLGADFRRVRGETRENYSYVNGSYTRQRVAGGTQTLGGLFWLHERPFATNGSASLGLRADGWIESKGRRRETDRATGAVFRDDAIGARRGNELSPSAGVVWQPNDRMRWRFAVQRAFRRPTLNELYRPFRVGNIITEANPSLRTETITSGEVGWEMRTKEVELRATVFWNDLRDAVSNVTVARGPGTFADFGFIPAGGGGRRRLNLERVRVQGLELAAEWRASDQAAVTADFIFNDAIVRRAIAAPHLEGLRLAQVSRIGASVGLRWRPAKAWTIVCRLRYVGEQFEDDENELRLAPAWIGDFMVSWSWTKQCEWFAKIENIGEARLETGRSPDGGMNTGTPRLALSGLRWTW